MKLFPFNTPFLASRSVQSSTVQSASFSSNKPRTPPIIIPSERPQNGEEGKRKTTWYVSFSSDSGGDKLQSGSVTLCPSSPRQAGGEAKPGESMSANITPSEGPQNGPGGGSLQQSSTASVVLTSTGPSAEIIGSCLGVFDYHMQWNNCPAYRQRHTVANKLLAFFVGTYTQPQYLYKDEDGDWCVGEELGGSSSLGLLNRTKTDSVPNTDWLYGDGKEWTSDPKLTVSTSLPSVCPEINISLHGAAARAQSRAGGEYKPTGEWSSGHPVFSNGELYLRVRSRGTAWYVSSRPESGYARSRSGSVTWCPTNPRAAFSHRDNIRSWQYADSGAWHDGDIHVKNSHGKKNALLILRRKNSENKYSLPSVSQTDSSPVRGSNEFVNQSRVRLKALSLSKSSKKEKQIIELFTGTPKRN